MNFAKCRGEHFGGESSSASWLAFKMPTAYRVQGRPGEYRFAMQFGDLERKWEHASNPTLLDQVESKQ
jgi:hypothetical protein